MTSIVANGGTDTIYIQQVGALYYYSINTGASVQITSFPITVQNSVDYSILPIIFKTNLTIYNTTPNFYFICGSTFLRFGRTDRNDDGSRPTITISGVTNYPGFIQNGTSTTVGYRYVSIFNIVING